MQVSIERHHLKLTDSRSPLRLPHSRTTRSSPVCCSASTPVCRLRHLHVAVEDLPLCHVVALLSACQSCHCRAKGSHRPRSSAIAGRESIMRGQTPHVSALAAGHGLPLPTGLAWLWAACAALCQWAACTVCSWAARNRPSCHSYFSIFPV
jgi:hypothetical protein